MEKAILKHGKDYLSVALKGIEIILVERDGGIAVDAFYQDEGETLIDVNITFPKET